MNDPAGGGRRAELAGHLAELEARLAAACAAARRDRATVTLVAVTKGFPAADVRALAALGVTDVAENRHQEARDKHAEVAGDLPDLRWHFVGQLQRNKAGPVASYADAVHSVDRTELAAALGRAARTRRDHPLDVLVQVDLDPGGAAGGPPRGGAGVLEVAAVAGAVAAEPALRLRGVMAVAPLGGDPDAAFATLREVSLRVRDRWPDAGWVSAGMSGDLEQAIRHGATHVRVGSALLGTRPVDRGTVKR